jgi:hypothetical protein
MGCPPNGWLFSGTSAQAKRGARSVRCNSWLGGIYLSGKMLRAGSLKLGFTEEDGRVQLWLRDFADGY